MEEEDDYYMSGSSEEEDGYCSSDQDAEFLDELERQEDDAPKPPSSKVCTPLRHYFGGMHVKKRCFFANLSDNRILI